MDAITSTPRRPVGARLHVIRAEDDPLPAPSRVAMDIAGRTYLIEFWSDQTWQAIPEALRPVATRAHSDDGWFLISALAEFLANLPPLV